MEKWKIKTVSGVAKLGGIVICIGGVLVLGFYKGFSIPPLIRIHQLDESHTRHVETGHHTSNIWLKGFILMVAANLLFAFWMVMQAYALKLYPSKLLFTTLSTLLSSAQSFVIAVALERDLSEWKLGWNLRLVSVAYCGIVVTGVSYYLQAYIIQKKGPVFLAMTTPLNLVITVVFSSLLLGVTITLGSIIGAIILVGGLYSVLWGKSKEGKGLCCTIQCETLVSDASVVDALGEGQPQQEIKQAHAATQVV